MNTNNETLKTPSDSENKVLFAVSQPYTKELLRQWMKTPVTPVGKFSFIVKYRIIPAILILLAATCVITILFSGAPFISMLDIALYSLLDFALVIFLLFNLRLSAARQHKIASQLQGTKNVELKYEFREHDMSVIVGNTTSTFPYERFWKITEHDNYMYLWLDNLGVERIHKESFIAGSAAELRAFVEPKLGAMHKKGVNAKRLIVRTIVLSLAILMVTLPQLNVIGAITKKSASPLAARKAYYRLRIDNNIEFAEINTEDSLVTFSTDRTTGKIYSTVYSQKDGAYKVISDGAWTLGINDWAESNRGYSAFDLNMSGYGILQVSEESKQQVRFTILPSDYDTSKIITDKDNSILTRFTNGEKEYILYAVVE